VTTDALLRLQSVTGFGQVAPPQISRDSDVVQAWRGLLLTRMKSHEINGDFINE
jgi:hypothetical protein